MKVNNLWLVACLIFSISAFTQQKRANVPLREIISQIEKKFEVKFSYAEEDVSEVLLAPPSDNLSLTQTISFLNANTFLNFKLLNDRYITVSTLNKEISVCGILKTETDKSPLFGASVVILGINKGGVSDEQGRFYLEDVPINATIEISFLGYISLRVKAKEISTLSFSCRGLLMKENSEVLNQVLITKFLTTGIQKLADGSTVLNTDQFGILPGLIEPDILQSIQALPGVESSNESITNLNVRGGTNDQNLLIWDNIRMYHSGHFFGLISAFNPNLTDKVIVTKNGSSSEFSDGVSSIVNMFTDNELKRNLSGGAGLNLISGDAYLQIPITKTIEIHLSGRRSITDYITTPTYDNYFERSFQDSDLTTTNQGQSATDFYFYDYTGKILFDLNEQHRFRANVIGISNNLNFIESLSDTNNQNPQENFLAQENLGMGANWEASWSSKFRTHLMAHYSKYNIDSDELEINTGQRLQQANEVLETGIKFNSYLDLNDNLQILNGYQVSETGISNKTLVSSPSYYREKKDVLLNHALFSEVEYNKDKTYIRGGVRINYFQKFQKFIPEPRLSFRRKLSRFFALKVEGEFKNQAATQVVDFQDNFLGVENRRWILANDSDIPIAVSKQGSLGMEFNHNNLLIDITGFYKVVDGIIARNQGFYNNFQFLNAKGSYTAKGVEFLANKTALNYSAWLSYTYSLNDYEFLSFNPSVFPNNVDIRHSVSLAFNYDLLENLQISMGGIWRSGVPFTSPLEGNETVQNGNTYFVNYDRPNSKNVDYFFRLDASVNYQFSISDDVTGSLRGGVRNLTDRKNIINRYYEVDQNDNDNALEINNSSLRVTPNISLRVNF